MPSLEEWKALKKLSGIKPRPVMKACKLQQMMDLNVLALEIIIAQAFFSL